MNKRNFNIVGKPVIRRDGCAKVTGKAKYADDFRFEGELYGVMVRTNSSHAIIKKIDYSEIADNPSVKLIIDANDIPGKKKVGPIKQDQPVFCNERIVTPGDVIAMLVGEKESELRQLAKRIRIELEELPLLENPRNALDKDAILIHPEFKTNLITHYPLRKGNIEKGFNQSDEIIEQTYTTQLVEHAYIEPECVTAIPGEGNLKIKIIGSIQNPFTTRKVVASVLDCGLNKVEIIQAELGGSFGGKDDIMNILSARAAIAALKSNRPIKIKYNREESIIESYKRHPYILNYKIGFKRDGKIKAIKIDLLADGGAYSSMSPFVTWRSVVQATGPYEIKNVHTDVRVVYTNNPYTGAMRGFGSPQPIFAIESMMDEIALRVGKTPFEIRKINGFKQGSVTASGQKLSGHEVTLNKVLKKAVDVSSFSSKWVENKKSVEKNEAPTQSYVKNSLILHKDDFINPDKLWRKGIGLALSYRGCSLGAEGIDAAASYVSIQPDGTVYLLSGLAENGQGLKTTYSIVAAEVLGISADKIIYLEQNTSRIPDSGPTVASRATLMGGGATKNACEELKKRLGKLLVNEWRLKSPNELHFANGTVTYNGKKKKISFDELIKKAYTQGVNLSAIGWYAGPKVHWEEETGHGSAYFTYVYGCQVAEVSVNIGTGEVYINNIWAVHDPGKVINILGAEGQVYGGTTQGAGYGLWEKISTHEGKIRENNFDQFLIPTSKDIDAIDPYFIEGKDKYGAWGGKSLGEPTLELTAAAIANAITNATGQRFFNLPINIEELLLRKKLYPESLKRGSIL